MYNHSSISSSGGDTVKFQTLVQKIKEFIRKRREKRKLEDMDRMWYLTGRSSWELFPPSFYYTHTPEEIKKETAELMERVHKLIDELED